MLKFASHSHNSTMAQRMLAIVERLRLGSSKRRTVNVMRNKPAISLAGQQCNRLTLDETNLASPRVMERVFSQLVGLPVRSRCAGVIWLNTCRKMGFGAIPQGLKSCDLRCEVMNHNSPGNLLLGIMPYDNHLEGSECSAIMYWANIYAK